MSDIDIKHIVDGKRIRAPAKYHTSAAIDVEPKFDPDVMSGAPFFSCLANAITTDHLDEKINRFDHHSSITCSSMKNKDTHMLDNPTSWKKMQKHPSRTQFLIAAETEFQGLEDRHARDVININNVPENAKIFPMRLVFVTKKDGDLIKYKARVVVRGDLDKTPYNRDEIYSHTSLEIKIYLVIYKL